MQGGSSTLGLQANGSLAAVLTRLDRLDPRHDRCNQSRYGKPIAEPVYEDESDDSPNPFGEIGSTA